MSSEGKLAILPAAAGDFPWIQDRLAAESLPTEGVEPMDATFLIAMVDERRVGAIGLEDHGSFGLLRSVIVEPNARGRGVGLDLTRAMLDLALERGFRSLFLLTENAADFFMRLGFEPVPRSDAPTPIKESAEFKTLCPASATLMKRNFP
jgi:amino-acid N-acetyltransferase